MAAGSGRHSSMCLPASSSRTNIATSARFEKYFPAGHVRLEVMIHRLSHATIYVNDQDAAKKFYVETLGLDLRTDASLPNGFRWLTVSPKEQPDLEIILMKVDGPNLKPETATALKALL